MKQFSNLKTVHIRITYGLRCHYQMNFLNIYSSEILCNVENFIIEQFDHRPSNSLEFIKHVPKLRKLSFYGCIFFDEVELFAIELLAIVKKILLDRRNGQTTEDFITLEIDNLKRTVQEKSKFEVFCEINDIGESIKITPITDGSPYTSTYGSIFNLRIN